jgi:hypothetical protein
MVASINRLTPMFATVVAIGAAFCEDFDLAPALRKGVNSEIDSYSAFFENDWASAAGRAAHWGIPDPAAAIGPEAEIELAFLEAARQLRNRIGLLVELPIEKLDHQALHSHLRDIGATADRRAS